MSSFADEFTLVLTGRTARWWAKMIDRLMIALALAPSYLANVLAANEWATIALWFAMVCLLALLGVQMHLLLKQGQSLGKKFMRARIVTVRSGEHPRWYSLLLRGLLSTVFSFIPFVAPIDALLIFRENRRCLHDLIAGTKVVNDSRE